MDKLLAACQTSLDHTEYKLYLPALLLFASRTVTCWNVAQHKRTYLVPAKRTRSRLGYTYVSASSVTFQLTASAVGNRGYVSPWGGANWLRRTAVNRGTAMSSRCTVTIFTRVLTHKLAGKAGRPSRRLSILLGGNDAWNLLLNEQRSVSA